MLENSELDSQNGSKFSTGNNSASSDAWGIRNLVQTRVFSRFNIFVDTLWIYFKLCETCRPHNGQQIHIKISY